MKTIVESEEKLRIDKYLSTEFDYSRSKIKRLVDNGKILVNGKIIDSNNYKVKLNDEIEITDEMIVNTDVKAQDIKLDIVYEDEYLIIVNKPSGMVVHPALGHYSNTLVNALLYHFNLSHKGSIRPGIVHRIDKDTSGILVVAKDDKTHEMLANMIKEKQIERTYLALVDGVIMNDTGTIDAPIGRDEKNRQKYIVTGTNAKESITHFKVLERFKNNTLLEVKLETGRTHQIRVHMKYINHPVYNDFVYGNKSGTSFGQFLHSKSIKFIHPRTNIPLYFECDEPSYFKDELEKIRNK
ncbi:MAG: RluA family pseudouridine synthase [Bacilli bacterium]